MTKFTQTYPTDLKYTEWLLIMDFFPSHRLGRPPQMENAANYQCRSVRCANRMPEGNEGVFDH